MAHALARESTLTRASSSRALLKARRTISAWSSLSSMSSTKFSEGVVLSMGSRTLRGDGRGKRTQRPSSTCRNSGGASRRWKRRDTFDPCLAYRIYRGGSQQENCYIYPILPVRCGVFGVPFYS